MSFTVLGTGHALPEHVVTNDYLSKMMDTSDEWIIQKTGIKERRVLKGETLTDLAVLAAKHALTDALLDVSEIDLLLCATIFGDTFTPSTACIIAEKIGANCAAFDINAACTGFIYALDIAAGYFARKKVKKILIVCADQCSRLVDWTDRSTCVLFGDGAGAAVLGEGADLLSIRITAAPNSGVIKKYNIANISPFNEGSKKIFPHLTMNGQEVYKFAVNAACNDLRFVIKEAGLCEKDIDWFLLHQANMRIIDAAINQLCAPKEKFINCIEKTGNVSAASVPILLDIGNSGKFNKGNLIAMAAFGAGLTTGAAVLRWNK